MLPDPQDDLTEVLIKKDEPIQPDPQMENLIKKDELHPVNATKLKAAAFECGICYCTEADLSVDPETGKLDTTMLSCNHMFCTECFVQYYISLIEQQGKHDFLKCP